MGARAPLRFDKFRQHPLQARSVLRLWGVCDAFAMREALEEGCDAITFIGKMYIYTKFLKKSLVFVYF